MQWVGRHIPNTEPFQGADDLFDLTPSVAHPRWKPPITNRMSSLMQSPYLLDHLLDPGMQRSRSDDQPLHGADDQACP